MTGFQDRNGTLYADGVALSDIAEAAGTPTYVYSAGAIRAQYERLTAAMKKALPGNRQPMLCYACKANSHTAILTLLQKLGCGLEIVSEGELIRGLKAGFAPNMIVSTGVGKSENEIAACLNAGIHQINVESLPELARIGRIAEDIGKTARVVFRLNPDVSGGGHHKISTGRKHDKFGLNAAKVAEGFALARDMKGIEAIGISTHIGSQVFEVDAFRKAFGKLPALVKDLRAAGHRIERLDIGGGFPIVYKDEQLLDLDAYASWVNEIIVPLATEIIMEPGRFLVGNAGVLLSRVAYVKEAENNFLILDAAMNDLIRPTLYEAWHGIEPVENRAAKPKTYDVVGPVCESGDTFATDRSIPEMQQGDLAVIRSAGAYGFSMASNYNTRPLPAEVLVDDGKFAIIRQRQGYEDIMKGESVPDWLK